MSETTPPSTLFPARTEPFRALIVVPCYNEEQRLPREAFAPFLATMEGVGFLFVNDGSRDATEQVLAELCTTDPARMVFHSLAQNSGKAEAVRRGVLLALRERAAVVGFWDADLATPLAEIPRFLELMERDRQVEWVIGARVKLLGRRIERRLLRHYIGRAFATVASNYLRLPVYDTQCGAKIFRNNARTRRLFSRRFVARWIFDVELLARFLKDWRGRRSDDPETAIVEVPLAEWADVKGSKVKGADFLKAFGELFRIMRTYGLP
jgi:glycosyltransferase involved in cell wall biosynthesis